MIEWVRHAFGLCEDSHSHMNLLHFFAFFSYYMAIIIFFFKSFFKKVFLKFKLFLYKIIYYFGGMFS